MTELVRFLIKVQPLTEKGKVVFESPLNENNRHTLCSLEEFGITPCPPGYLVNRRKDNVTVSFEDFKKVTEKVTEKNKKNKLVQEEIKIIKD